MMRGFIVHGLPLIFAIGAALLLLPWIMGASAIQGETASQGFNVGVMALFLYPACYQLFIIAWGICRWQRWRLESLFVRLIWASLVLFLGAMAYALIALQDYLQGSA